MLTVFSSYDRGLIAQAKTILQKEGIKYLTKGENLLGMLHFRNVWDAVQIQVRQEDAERARCILKNLKS